MPACGPAGVPCLREGRAAIPRGPGGGPYRASGAPCLLVGPALCLLVGAMAVPGGLAAVRLLVGHGGPPACGPRRPPSGEALSCYLAPAFSLLWGSEEPRGRGLPERAPACPPAGGRPRLSACWSRRLLPHRRGARAALGAGGALQATGRGPPGAASCKSRQERGARRSAANYGALQSRPPAAVRSASRGPIACSAS